MSVRKVSPHTHPILPSYEFKKEEGKNKISFFFTLHTERVDWQKKWLS